jgi:hypothetical protein
VQKVEVTPPPPVLPILAAFGRGLFLHHRRKISSNRFQDGFNPIEDGFLSISEVLECLGGFLNSINVEVKRPEMRDRRLGFIWPPLTQFSSQ